MKHEVKRKNIAVNEMWYYKIVAEVNHQLAVERGDVIEVNTDSKDDETMEPEVSNSETD